MGGDPVALAAEGYTFLWIGSVSTVLRQSFAAAVESVREAEPR